MDCANQRSKPWSLSNSLLACCNSSPMCIKSVSTRSPFSLCELAPSSSRRSAIWRLLITARSIGSTPRCTQSLRYSLNSLTAFSHTVSSLLRASNLAASRANNSDARLARSALSFSGVNTACSKRCKSCATELVNTLSRLERYTLAMPWSANACLTMRPSLPVRTNTAMSPALTGFCFSPLTKHA